MAGNGIILRIQKRLVVTEAMGDRRPHSPNQHCGPNNQPNSAIDYSPNSASSILEESRNDFLQLVRTFAWFNPHLSLSAEWRLGEPVAVRSPQFHCASRFSCACAFRAKAAIPSPRPAEVRA